ncbi:MAG: hypothetical protein AAF242_00225 [Bacteroidota bacterium]
MIFSRKQKALKSFQKLKEDINSKDVNESHADMLTDLISKYIGENSRLHNSAISCARSFGVNDARKDEQRMKEIIDRAIFFIENSGVKKESSFWRGVESMNQKVTYSIIATLIAVIFGFGKWYGGPRGDINSASINARLDSIHTLLDSSLLLPTQLSREVSDTIKNDTKASN